MFQILSCSLGAWVQVKVNYVVHVCYKLVTFPMSCLDHMVTSETSYYCIIIMTIVTISSDGISYCSASITFFHTLEQLSHQTDHHHDQG